MKPHGFQVRRNSNPKAVGAQTSARRSRGRPTPTSCRCALSIRRIGAEGVKKPPEEQEHSTQRRKRAEGTKRTMIT